MHVLLNKKLNVSIEVLSNGSTSSKGLDGYNKFNERVDEHVKSKTHRQSVMRLANNYCIKDTNAGFMSNLLSIAHTEHAEN